MSFSKAQPWALPGRPYQGSWLPHTGLGTQPLEGDAVMDSDSFGWLCSLSICIHSPGVFIPKSFFPTPESLTQRSSSSRPVWFGGEGWGSPWRHFIRCDCFHSYHSPLVPHPGSGSIKLPETFVWGPFNGQNSRLCWPSWLSTSAVFHEGKWNGEELAPSVVLVSCLYYQEKWPKTSYTVTFILD